MIILYILKPNKYKNSTKSFWKHKQRPFCARRPDIEVSLNWCKAFTYPMIINGVINTFWLFWKKYHETRNLSVKSLNLMKRHGYLWKQAVYSWIPNIMSASEQISLHRLQFRTRRRKAGRYHDVLLVHRYRNGCSGLLMEVQYAQKCWGIVVGYRPGTTIIALSTLYNTTNRVWYRHMTIVSQPPLLHCNGLVQLC